jgi:hypothetical protein
MIHFFNELVSTFFFSFFQRTIKRLFFLSTFEFPSLSSLHSSLLRSIKQENQFLPLVQDQEKMKNWVHHQPSTNDLGGGSIWNPNTLFLDFHSHPVLKPFSSSHCFLSFLNAIFCSFFNSFPAPEITNNQNPNSNGPQGFFLQSQDSKRGR